MCVCVCVCVCCVLLYCYTIRKISESGKCIFNLKCTSYR